MWPTRLIKRTRETKQGRLFLCTVLASHGGYSAPYLGSGFPTQCHIFYAYLLSLRGFCFYFTSRQWSGVPLGEDCEDSGQITGRNIQWCQPAWRLVYNWAYCMAGMPIILSSMNKPEKQFWLSTHHLSFLKIEVAEKSLVFTGWLLYTMQSVQCVLRYKTHRSGRQISMMISILFC